MNSYDSHYNSHCGRKIKGSSANAECHLSTCKVKNGIRKPEHQIINAESVEGLKHVFYFILCDNHRLFKS